MPAPVSTSPPAVLRLLSDPLRWRVVSELARSDRRVSELTVLVGEPQNLVSYHLRELRDAGLVTSRRSSFDGRDKYYRAELHRCAAQLCAVGAEVQPGLRLVVAPPPPRPRGRTRRVLFLCTGNSARSQMAEALLEHRSGHTIQARSAGSHPKPLHPYAVQVMAARSIDISGCTPKHLRRFARSRFDVVVTLCDRVREVCPELPGGPEAAHWSMPDPSRAGGDDQATYAAFEQTADELETRIGHLIARLSAEKEHPHDQ
jgi:ArsR family transcriptional regulator, arsenate/arsenite/antimonite-responsive transcriptional repressor / arsenate reductase (thioredoxin)